ncbi:MAG: polyamine aminopropyltransferase [Desulfatitalea sp.]|nr:polyamine aminopropyltransferase [Desulfatitalea sp.]NNJ98812.1 polyamine aminopropyltransferase [Desulfatitalea sp.]
MDAIKRPFSPATFLLASSIFATGLTGLVLEYIQATIATYVLGNSIEQYSLVIGMMLFMMGVAASAQKMFTDSHLIEKFILIEILLALIGGFSPLAVYWAFGATAHFLPVQYFFILSLGFLIGLEIPVVLRINEAYSRKLSLNIESVFFADYLGALAGALLWVFVLLRYLPLTESSFLLAGVNLSIAVATYAYFRRFKAVRRQRIIFGFIVMAAAALVWGYANNRVWNFQLEQRLYDDPIVFQETTVYQHLVMTRNATRDEYRFFINGNLQFSSLDERRYHELLVHPALSAGAHNRVLILGGGDGLALREVLKYEDVREVTLIDLDVGMTRFAAKNPVMVGLNAKSLVDARVVVIDSGAVRPGIVTPVFMEGAKTEPETGMARTTTVATVNVMNIDADTYLSAARGYYDVVIIDLPDPSSIELAKLYSREFYEKVRKVLSETGIMVVQATAPFLAKESFLCIGRTLRSAGWHVTPYHESIPSFGDWGWYICSNARLSKSFHLRRLNRPALAVATTYYSPAVFARAMVFGKGELETEHGAINTRFQPVLLDLYLRASWQYE